MHLHHNFWHARVFIDLNSEIKLVENFIPVVRANRLCLGDKKKEKKRMSSGCGRKRRIKRKEASNETLKQTCRHREKTRLVSFSEITV